MSLLVGDSHTKLTASAVMVTEGPKTSWENALAQKRSARLEFQADAHPVWHGDHEDRQRWREA